MRQASLVGALGGERENETGLFVVREGDNETGLFAVLSGAEKGTEGRQCALGGRGGGRAIMRRRQ